MNYHFDDFTIIQLIHLLRDQELDIEGLVFDSGRRECRIECERKAEPNAGPYTLVIRGLISCSRDYPDGKSKDICRDLSYEAGEKAITISGDAGSVTLTVESVDVSALGGRGT